MIDRAKIDAAHNIAGVDELRHARDLVRPLDRDTIINLVAGLLVIAGDAFRKLDDASLILGTFSQDPEAPQKAWAIDQLARVVWGEHYEGLAKEIAGGAWDRGEGPR